jgi:hypothetical protein
VLALLQSSPLAKTKVPVTTLIFPEEVPIRMSGIAICFCFQVSIRHILVQSSYHICVLYG